MTKKDRTALVMKELNDIQEEYNDIYIRVQNLTEDDDNDIRWYIRCRIEAQSHSALTIYHLCRDGLDVESYCETKAHDLHWNLLNLVFDLSK